MDDKLVSFESSFIETPADFGDEAPAATACASIDGYPSDPDASGRVVCRVWQVAGGFIEDWREPEYRLCPAAKDAVESAKQDMRENLLEQAAAPASKRESAILDWMFRNTRSCPFDDESGLDFESICKGFGTEGCRACILENIEKLDKKGG